jgi:TRAP-type C4-dicarboxylate transport system permease small subunit
VPSFLSHGSNLLEKKSQGWSTFSLVVGAIGLLAMMITTVADAIGRRFFNFPIYGSYELVSFLLSFVAFSSICYCAFLKRHFSVDLIGSRFTPRVRLIILTIMYLVSVGITWLMGWRLVIYGFAQQASNATGNDLKFLPIYPLVWAVALFAFVGGWVFLLQAIDFLGKATQRKLWK